MREPRYQSWADPNSVPPDMYEDDEDDEGYAERLLRRLEIERDLPNG